MTAAQDEPPLTFEQRMAVGIKLLRDRIDDDVINLTHIAAHAELSVETVEGLLLRMVKARRIPMPVVTRHIVSPLVAVPAQLPTAAPAGPPPDLDQVGVVAGPPPAPLGWRFLATVAASIITHRWRL